MRNCAINLCIAGIGGNNGLEEFAKRDSRLAVACRTVPCQFVAVTLIDQKLKQLSRILRPLVRVLRGLLGKVIFERQRRRRYGEQFGLRPC